MIKFMRIRPKNEEVNVYKKYEDYWFVVSHKNVDFMWPELRYLVLKNFLYLA